MKSLLALLFLVAPFIAHATNLGHEHHFLARREHSQLVHRASANYLSKRCSNKRKKSAQSTPKPPQSKGDIDASKNNGGSNFDKSGGSSSGKSGGSSPDTSNSKSNLNPKPQSDITNNVKGLINVKSTCGDIGATKDVTATTGPNGSLDWLTCGINDGGWRPPVVKVGDLVMKDLGQALKSSSSPFKACSRYVDLFYQYGQENGLPAILLASFALQESSCRPDTTGGAGEQGLMQITKDKCGGAPGGNCKDPEFNIRTGAKFIADTLAANGGNIIKTIGMYNGWRVGLTYEEATAAASSRCCRCQNNLDYPFQFLNGWLQNKDAYDNNPRLGKYFNLDKCN